MTTQKRWGLFAADGQPIAPGDDHHKWKCQQQQYEPTGYVHTITCEWVDTGMDAVPCPFKATSVKTDECTKCGVVFIYP